MILTWVWEKHTYSVHKSKVQLSWFTAERKCKSIGGHLLSIHSNNEFIKIQKELFSLVYTDEYNKRVMAYQHIYYIGLQTLVSTFSGTS